MDIGRRRAGRKTVESWADGTTLPAHHVTDRAGGHGVLPEDLLAAGRHAGGHRCFASHGQFAKLHVVIERIADRDVQQVDAGLGALAAVEDDLDLGPVRFASGHLLGLRAAEMVVEAGLTPHRMGLDPGAEAIFGVRLEFDVGKEARVGVGAGDGTHGVLARTHVLRVDDDTPLRVLVAGTRTVIATLPADRCLLIVGDVFEIS